MNQPQQKLAPTFTSSVSAENSAVPAVQVAPESGVIAVASPALALQARLNEALQPASVFEDRHAVLKMLTVFASACAGTWVFGALLYMQF
jgi:hypothetical protein